MSGKTINGTLRFVYVIQHGDSDLYKIGFSKDPLVRLIAMQTDNPMALTIIGLKSTHEATATERRIHKTLSMYHHRGEWFRLDTVTLEKLFLDFDFTVERIVTPDNSLSVNSKVNTFMRLGLQYHTADVGRDHT